MTSFLYVPCDPAEKCGRLERFHPSAFILDLEDSVISSRKEQARTTAVATIRRLYEAEAAPVWVRINTDAVGMDDLDSVVCRELTGVLVPKVESGEILWSIDSRISVLERRRGLPERSIQVIPMIETAGSLENMHAIARGPRVCRLHLGEVDLQADLLMLGATDEDMLPFRLDVVVASRVHGLEPPLGPVFLDLSDSQLLRSSSTHLRRIGFGGRAVIHPGQLADVDSAFGVTDEEFAAAEDVLMRFEVSVVQGSGVAVDQSGRMLDEAVIRGARSVVARRMPKR